MQRRSRLEGPGDAEGFPVIEAMQRSGATDLSVRIVPFAESAEIFVGAAISATTDRPRGFTDPELAILNELTPTIGLSAYRMLMSESFARACSAPVASLGRFELRGVSGEREVFALLDVNPKVSCVANRVLSTHRDT